MSSVNSIPSNILDEDSVQLPQKYIRINYTGRRGHIGINCESFIPSCTKAGWAKYLKILRAEAVWSNENAISELRDWLFNTIKLLNVYINAGRKQFTDEWVDVTQLPKRSEARMKAKARNELLESRLKKIINTQEKLIIRHQMLQEVLGQ